MNDVWRRCRTKPSPTLPLTRASARRMRSPTLLERHYCHGAAREVNGNGVIVGLPYSILAWTTQRGSSFAPGDKAVDVAVAQVCWLGF